MESLIIAKFVLATPWLIYLGVKDYRTRKLPNAATLGGAAVMSAIALGVGTDYFLASIITGCLCALFLLLPFFLRAAGAGDVKMLFASGIIAGPGNTLNLMGQHQSQWILMKDAALDKDPQSIIFKVFIAVG